jgi:chemotaxis protein CheX
VPVTVRTPYIMRADDHVTHDFSAIIGVSGSQHGVVYYSAPRKMLSELVRDFGETSVDDDLLADYVGEIANMVSGNAREYFSNAFMISVPKVVSSERGPAFPENTPAFVVPLEWSGHESSLVICLREGQHSAEFDSAVDALDRIEDSADGDDD